jgi:hypothetical protein
MENICSRYWTLVLASGQYIVLPWIKLDRVKNQRLAQGDIGLITQSGMKRPD